MNLVQIKNMLKDGGIEDCEARVEAKMLVGHFLGLSEVDLAIKGDFEPTQELLDAVKLRVDKRIPIQHVIGTAYFMGEDFIVNENVLIPRDETEILVRCAVEIIKDKEKTAESVHVLDIGTGSGCIACTIAKNTHSQVLGVDISCQALEVAIENASKLGLFNRAIFRKSDLFSNVRKEGFGFEKFDLIISNPPYIPVKEKSLIQKEVTFEPELALYAKDFDGVEFYDKIITQAPDYLNEEGYLMFELGIGQAQKVKEMMIERGFLEIEIIKDLAGIERVISGKLGS